VPASFTGILKLVKVRMSLASPSPQWWFGWSTGFRFWMTWPLLPTESVTPVPASSNASAKARLVASRSRNSPKRPSEPRPTGTPHPPFTLVVVPSSL
jgi:hypothetical protein